jgi:hypothetical protein
MQHLVGASDRSATPADGICVGTVIVVWSQLDFGARELVLPARYRYLPVAGYSAPECAGVLHDFAPTASDLGTVYRRLLLNTRMLTYRVCNAAGHPHLPQRIHVL